MAFPFHPLDDECIATTTSITLSLLSVDFLSSCFPTLETTLIPCSCFRVILYFPEDILKVPVELYHKCLV